MTNIILEDLRQRYGNKILLSPEDLTEVLGVSVGQQANLRSSRRFPMPVSYVGRSVKVSIYALADYLSGEAEAVARDGLKREQAQPEAQRINRTEKKKRTGAMGKDWWIGLVNNGFFNRIDQAVLHSKYLPQVDFGHSVEQKAGAPKLL